MAHPQRPAAALLLVAFLPSTIFGTAAGTAVCPAAIKLQIKALHGFRKLDFLETDATPDDAEDHRPLDYFVLVGEPLGEGSFGSVRLAALSNALPAKFDVGSKFRLFAIKTTRYDASSSEYVLKRSAEQRFVEPELQFRVSGGPFVVRTWGSWQTPETRQSGTYSLVMSPAVSDLEAELLGKGKFNKRAGGIAEDVTKKWVAQIVVALGHIHERGLVHVDLKPKNILLDATGSVMVADFGNAIEFKDLKTDKALTAAGDCPIISPDLFHKYLSAEWTTSMGNYFDHTADFWSLGVIVWKMLKGIENYEDPAASLFSFPSWDAHGCRVAYFWYEQMKTLMAAEQKREKARAEKSGRPTTLAARKAAWQRAYARWAAITFNKYIRLKELDGISKEARSFILNLLVVDPEKRLGGGPRTQTLARRAKEGWRKVLCHPWLASIDKVQLMQHGMLQAKHFNEPIVWDTPDGKIPAEPEGWLKRKEAAKAVASPPMSVTSEADARNEAPGMVVRPIVITDPAGDVKAEGERPLYATSFSPGLESTGNAVSAFGNGNRGGLRTSKGGAQNAESGGRSYATTFTTGFGGNVDANDEDESPVDYDSSEEDE